MAFDTIQLDPDGSVFYTSLPIPHSHPDRMTAVASVFGVPPADVDRCRVLELGCADGGNLLPMAEVLPDSEFVGIDLGPAEIDAGRQLAAEVGLKNVRLECGDLCTIDDDWGRFDFIICHGVFSWVSPEVQERILAVCRANLADHGVAYVNYNTYPGWHLHESVRGMLRLHAMDADDPRERVQRAKQAAAFYAGTLRSRNNPLAVALAQQLDAVRQMGDAFLFHAYLDVVNRPLHFAAFMRRVQQHELQHVADAQTAVRWTALPADVADTMPSLPDDRVQREQMADFLTNRASRYSLLCRAEVAVRDVPASPPPRPQRFASEIGEFPLTPKLARINAASGKPVATLRHECLKLSHFDRRMIQLLDGQHQLDDIRAILANDLEPQSIHDRVRDCLSRFQQHAMLLPSGPNP